MDHHLAAPCFKFEGGNGRALKHPNVPAIHANQLPVRVDDRCLEVRIVIKGNYRRRSTLPTERESGCGMLALGTANANILLRNELADILFCNRRDVAFIYQKCSPST